MANEDVEGGEGYVGKSSGKALGPGITPPSERKSVASEGVGVVLPFSSLLCLSLKYSWLIPSIDCALLRRH